MTGSVHTFHALAFVENLSLKELAVAYPHAKRKPHELSMEIASGGKVFVYTFGVIVFHDVSAFDREREITRIRQARGTLTEVVSEEFIVREVAGARPEADTGVLVVSQLGAEAVGVVAMSVAQSAAMEYYERIVDQMFVKTDKLVDQLEKVGTMPLATRSLHRFIGTAIGTRNEVISVLHLLDKPDAIWEDSEAERIYEQLRSEFDLLDRYSSLEHKLRSVQEALELLVDVARDRRLFLLEASIVGLIVFEIVLTLIGH